MRPFGARSPLRASAWALVLASACLLPGAGTAATLAGGAGSGLGTLRILADAYTKTEPQFSLEIVASLGNTGAIKALKRQAIELAVLTRNLRPDELTAELQVLEYAKTPVVLATAKKSVSGLTLAQIADIYAGRTTQWPDGTPIRLILRPPRQVEMAVLASFSPAVKEALARAHAREGMISALTGHDSVEEIARTNGGLGTASLALIVAEKHPLKALSIEGVAPSAKTLGDGTYPYYKTLYLATRHPPPAGLARFVAFVHSAEGRRILAQTGHWIGDVSDSRKSR